MERVDFDSISEEGFKQLFDTEEKCLEFLANVKWRNGFACKKCGNGNSCPGKTPHSRRCTRCKHDESARVNTIFEGCRFELTKAFSILFSVCHSRGESSHELSRRLDLRQMTCWAFRKKLHDCMENRQHNASKQGLVNLEAIIAND